MTVDSLLKTMVDKKASDLFVTAGVAPSLKINGKVTPIADKTLTPQQARQLTYSLMSEDQKAEFEKNRECNFAIHRPDIGRFRINVFQQQNHTGMVVRKIETKIPTFTELHLPPLLKDLALAKQGLVIIAGATGVGKTTTLASMVGYRNRNSNNHIVCIEDPIEFIHQSEGCVITQREIGIDTDSVEVALKNSLRQAPDVILIGEIRSRDVMEQALAFADTGHLCLATLHANNSVQVIERIINFFGKDQRQQVLMDLSLNLRAVIAQRLVPVKKGHGRRPAFEILHTSPLLAAVLQRGDIAMLRDVMRKSPQYGMRTFDQDLYELYCDGKIGYEDAIHYADSANEIRLMIKLGEKKGVDDVASALEGVTLVDRYEDKDMPVTKHDS